MTLKHRFFRGYAVVSAFLAHTFFAAHYVYLEQTCTGWDCLGTSIYGRTLVLGAVGIAVLAASGIALDEALARHYGDERR